MKWRHCLGLWMGMAAGLAAAATAQEIGYVETFALAPDRAEALRELVPGTDDYYYYHALHAQNQGQRTDFQEWTDRWIRERRGTTVERARELLNRQALLDYDQTPDQTLAYLRDQLNPFFGHARKTGERRSSAPSTLDPRRIACLVLQSCVEDLADYIGRIGVGELVHADVVPSLCVRGRRWSRVRGAMG